MRVGDPVSYTDPSGGTHAGAVQVVERAVCYCHGIALALIRLDGERAPRRAAVEVHHVQAPRLRARDVEPRDHRGTAVAWLPTKE